MHAYCLINPSFKEEVLATLELEGEPYEILPCGILKLPHKWEANCRYDRLTWAIRDC